MKAIKYHWQDLIIAKEVGNPAGEGKVYEELGNTYSSKGDFSKAIKYHRQLRKVLFIKLVLNSVTSTPQRMCQPKQHDDVHDVCVFVCKCVLGSSRASQPLNILAYAFSSTSAFSL